MDLVFIVWIVVFVAAALAVLDGLVALQRSRFHRD